MEEASTMEDKLCDLCEMKPALYAGTGLGTGLGTLRFDPPCWYCLECWQAAVGDHPVLPAPDDGVPALVDAVLDALSAA